MSACITGINRHTHIYDYNDSSLYSTTASRCNHTFNITFNSAYEVTNANCDPRRQAHDKKSKFYHIDLGVGTNIMS